MSTTPLINSLESVRRRVRLLSLAYGVGVVLASAVGLLLVVVLLDYLLDLPPVPRLVVNVVALVALGWALFRFVIKQTLARLSLGDVAGRLERAFPQFEDRLRSTVNFTLSETTIPGSDAMKTRVVSETTRLASSLDLNRAVVAAPAWYSLGGAGGALAILLLLALTLPLYRDIALSRLISPFSSNPWPKRVQIELTGSLPPRVPVGERIDVRMKLTKGDSGARSPRRATIFYQYGDGPIQQELLTRGPDGTYAVSLDARAEATGGATLAAWITSGDDRAELPTVTIVPRLAISRVEATVVAPAYAGRGVSTVDLGAGSAFVVSGSDLTLHVTFNKPVDPARGVVLVPVNPEAHLPAVAWSYPAGAQVVGQWSASDTFRFRVGATDADGFKNAALEEYEIVVRPDQSPSVQIETPRRNEERTLESVVPLGAVTEDDFGIESMVLKVERLGDQQTWDISLVDGSAPVSGVRWTRAESGPERQRYRMDYPWELAALKDAALTTGDVLEYALTVRDNFELAGQRHDPVTSGKLRVTIISQEELTSRVMAELRTAAGQLEDVKRAQDRTRQETQQLKNDTQEKDALDPADRATTDRLTNQQATVATQTKHLASRAQQLRERLEQNKSPNSELKQLTSDVEQQLNNASENQMKSATQKLGAAKEQSPAAQRNESLEDAQKDQQQASDQLGKTLERLGNVGSLQQTIDKVNALLDKQRDLTKQTQEVGKNNLGKTPQQMKPEDREKLEKIAKEQQSLAEQTDKALADMQKAADAMSKSDPSTSESMSQASDTGKQQQVSSSMSKASQSASKNQQGSAQSAQKQAELGLEMILSELREAERRKLEELAKKLSELQEQLATLIRRQAGHNLDNLTLAGPDELKKLSKAALADLIERSRRDATAIPPAPAPGQLTAAQEQTERNTRDVARSSEDVQNGAESASLLTRAAGRMERAIVALRAKKLNEAYDPAQVEALAALIDAANKVDEEKRKVDEKRDEQTRESIRQAFVRIKGEQEKLNKETTRLDAAPRDAAGLARREDSIRLGQLPAEQGKLGEDLKKVGENLSAVGGVVYVWANKDIAETMERIKDDLNARRTDITVRAEQTRVVEQLDAMIRNLAVKPPEDKFEQAGGGGGGGGGAGGTPLPPEAELRLLKDLQVAVNKSTKAIADAKKNAE